MSKEQVLNKGIRQKSTKRVNSFIVCSAFCPGPLNRDPHGLQETNACLQVSRNNRTPHVACDCCGTHMQKSECVFKSPPIYNGYNVVRVYTASDTNWLNQRYTIGDLKNINDHSFISILLDVKLTTISNIL